MAATRPNRTRASSARDEFMKLTQSQQDAIEHGGTNLQLIACAGSGKTEVVARRVVHLLDPKKADSLQPANIVAFTFTDKAAAELEEQLSRLLVNSFESALVLRKSTLTFLSIDTFFA